MTGNHLTVFTHHIQDLPLPNFSCGDGILTCILETAKYLRFLQNVQHYRILLWVTDAKGKSFMSCAVYIFLTLLNPSHSMRLLIGVLLSGTQVHSTPPQDDPTFPEMRLNRNTESEVTTPVLPKLWS